MGKKIKQEMTKQDHKDWLEELEKGYGKGSMVFPMMEGAFYFSRYLTHDEYVEKYRKAVEELIEE